MFVLFAIAISKSYILDESYLTCIAAKYLYEELQNKGISKESILDFMNSQCSKLGSEYNNSCKSFVNHYLNFNGDCSSLLKSQKSKLLSSDDSYVYDICYDIVKRIFIVFENTVKIASTFYVDIEIFKSLSKIFNQISPYASEVCKFIPDYV